MMRVFVTFQFEHIHRWKDAKEPVAFLRLPHRHVFHVRAEFEVNHDDRDIEFITQKRAMIRFVETKQGDLSTIEWSCEHWCRCLANQFGAAMVEVSEDGENGAILRRN